MTDPEKSFREQRMEENKPIRVITVILAVLFLGMLVYFIWFELFEREEVSSNPLNNRYEAAESQVIRGSILSEDGVQLAYTEPGTSIDEDTRVYPFGQLFSTVTGYSSMGKTGLEASQNSILMTPSVDILKLLENDFTGTRSTGNTICTTIDSDLQYFCYQALGDYTGSVTITDPKTGKILVMLSKPSIDPNTVRENWDYLISEENTSGNLLNRSTQGLYAPGSTFKLVTAMEYIAENPYTYKDFRYLCTGSCTDEDGNVINCAGGTAHGEVDLQGAIAHSCNCAFVTLAKTLNTEKYRELCEELGFFSKLIDEVPSAVSTVTIGKDMSMFELQQTSFGQGNTMETPIQNLSIMAMIANRGTMMKPYLVDHVTNSEGGIVSQNKPKTLKKILDSEIAEYLNEALIGVVNDGTTPQAKSQYCQTAGKSGTAQFSESLEVMHAWFSGYAPSEDPEICVTVMLEGAGSASALAAPIFSQIVDYYFSR